MNESKLREKVLPNLSLNNVEVIANCFSGHMDVFAGNLGNCQLSFRVEWVCQNGFTLQLNSDKTELDSLYDDPFIRYAIQREIVDQYFDWYLPNPTYATGRESLDNEFTKLMCDYAEVLTETGMTSSELLEWVKRKMEEEK